MKQIRENAFDIRATGRLNRLYMELLRENADWSSEQRHRDMNHFMARLIFCFFAEDTGIFHNTGLFTATVEQMSAGNHSITHEVIEELFRAMNTPVKHEGNLDNRYRDAAKIKPWANVFPYVNGGLFSGSLDVPRFTKIARSYLIHVGSLDWTKINPDIFGSMIQAVADDEERGTLGMHYTSVPNILKVLNPLFLDELRARLDEAGENARKLLNLRQRLARIRVFDPACSSGNFLVIAYKELRAIEAEINHRRGEADRPTDLPLTNFRGIELRDFPAEIARLALIIAEYQCDVHYRGESLALAEFLPLDKANWITCGNALQIDWLSVCPPTGKGVKLRGNDLFETPLDQSHMAIIASRVHLVWIGTVCGKLKTDYRYSNTLGWNTFPVPTLTEQTKADLTRCAEDILLAREFHFPAIIAELYDPAKMPAHLREAHDRNDETLERIYLGRRFKDDTKSLEKLFELYTRMTAKQVPTKKVASRNSKNPDA